MLNQIIQKRLDNGIVIELRSESNAGVIIAKKRSEILEEVSCPASKLSEFWRKFINLYSTYGR